MNKTTTAWTLVGCLIVAPIMAGIGYLIYHYPKVSIGIVFYSMAIAGLLKISVWLVLSGKEIFNGVKAGLAEEEEKHESEAADG